MQLYQMLKKEKLLFSNKTIKEGGIWIISANCYQIEKNEEENHFKQGRIYFTIVAENESKCITLKMRFSKLLKEKGIYIY